MRPEERDALVASLAQSRSWIESLLEEVQGGSTVALFDWDHTVIDGDIGDLTLAYALREHALREFDVTNPDLGLTDEARNELSAPDPRAAIAHASFRGTTPGGNPAFTHGDTRFYRPMYGCSAHALGTLPESDLSELARRAWREARHTKPGEVLDVFGVGVQASARPRPRIVELMTRLLASGADVWVVSASPEPVIVEMAKELGFRADRVIGTRTRRDAGRVRFVPGADEPTVCWSEGKVLFARKRVATLVDTMPLLAVGDSEGDLAMMGWARRALLVDRGRPFLRVAAAELGAMIGNFDEEG